LELAAKLRIPAAEEPMTRYDIYTAQEAFMTGTAAEIVPVVSLDERPIGDAKPGPLTKKLMAAYKALTARQGERIPLKQVKHGR
jgi:branched-chain amino acid aminotransferase